MRGFVGAWRTPIALTRHRLYKMDRLRQCLYHGVDEALDLDTTTNLDAESNTSLATKASRSYRPCRTSALAIISISIALIR